MPALLAPTGACVRSVVRYQSRDESAALASMTPKQGEVHARAQGASHVITITPSYRTAAPPNTIWLL
jgi:hypothetical protein